MLQFISWSPCQNQQNGPKNGDHYTLINQKQQSIKCIYIELLPLLWECTKSNTFDIFPIISHVGHMKNLQCILVVYVTQLPILWHKGQRQLLMLLA